MNYKEHTPENRKELQYDIGSRIRQLRNASAMTQEKLADEMNVSVQYISKLELGKVGMSIDTLIRLCEILKASADYILTGRNPPAYDSPVLGRLQYLRPAQRKMVERAINLTIEAMELKKP